MSLRSFKSLLSAKIPDKRHLFVSEVGKRTGNYRKIMNKLPAEMARSRKPLSLLILERK